MRDSRRHDSFLEAERTASEALSLQELTEQALPHLAAATDSPVAVCYETIAGGGMKLHHLPHHEPFIRRFFEGYRGPDLLAEAKRRVNPRLAVTTDLVDRRAFLRSPQYNELYVPLDVEHQLVARLTTVGFSVPGCVALVLTRPARQPRFAPRELAMLERVLPSFEAAVRRSLRLADLQRRASALEALIEHVRKGSYLLLDAAGRMLWCSTAAARAFPVEIPEALVVAARRVAAAANAAVLSEKRTPWHLDLAGDQGPCRAELFVVREQPGGPPIVAVRLNAGTPAAVLEVARRAELTPAETAVLERLARGEGNRDVASALHVSHETVRTHVSRILRKLGARSRLEALAKVQAEH